MKKVFEAANPGEAHLVCGYLAEHGVRAIIQGELLWSARGELPLTSESSPSVWVKEEDFERADELVRHRPGVRYPTHCLTCGNDLHGLSEPLCPKCGATFDREKSASPEPWMCPTCGERIEGQFTDCWKCCSTSE